MPQRQLNVALLAIQLVQREQSRAAGPPEAQRGPCYFTISDNICTEQANHTPEAMGPTSFWQSGI